MDKYQYNERILTKEERLDFIRTIDETIESYSESLDGIYSLFLENEGDKANRPEIYSFLYPIASIFLFTTMTIADCLVAQKFFIIAERDYEKRFARGKLQVILNEGFKKLYGFDNGKKDAEWAKLNSIQTMLPYYYQKEYEGLTMQLESLSKEFNWWHDERVFEVHLKIEDLYRARKEEIIENKVMMDSKRLIDLLLRVQRYVGNVHKLYRDQLLRMYLRGELKDDRNSVERDKNLPTP